MFFMFGLAFTSIGQEWLTFDGNALRQEVSQDTVVYGNWTIVGDTTEYDMVITDNNSVRFENVLLEIELIYTGNRNDSAYSAMDYFMYFDSLTNSTTYHKEENFTGNVDLNRVIYDFDDLGLYANLNPDILYPNWAVEKGNTTESGYRPFMKNGNLHILIVIANLFDFSFNSIYTHYTQDKYLSTQENNLEDEFKVAAFNNTISITSNNNNFNYAIYNMQGQMVEMNKVDGSTVTQLLESGCYFVKILKDGEVFTSKIMI